jgi:quercetin dioxygenase-like cupin family protein
VGWHYHTAEEQLVVIRGLVLTEMDGMASSTLGPGGFALMPSKKHHQFSCRSDSDCLMMVSFDRPYDIFWVKEGSDR